MPPEPLPWDRKDFFKERKHERSDTTSSSFGGGSTPRWREFSYSSSNHYGSSRDFNRWGPYDFRRPPGHGKQGGWHMHAEEPGHVYAPYRSGDKMLEDENCRPFLRGDGRYGRNPKENRGYFSQRDWRGGHSWEMSLGSPNMPGRQHDMSNDQRSVDEMLMYPPSHNHPDFVNSRDHHQLKDQDDSNKMGGVIGLGTCQIGDRENSLDWKPLKWTRSGSLSSRGSGFSHSSSSKSLGGADSNEGRAELQPRNATPVQSPSGDIEPSEETSSRKKARLGWGEGLAKYEKKKVEGPDASGSKDGAIVSASNIEPVCCQSLNLVEKSPRLMGFSDCASPATPSSVACSFSPGIEEKTFVKSMNADNDVSNLCGSPSIGSQSHLEGISFNLEKLDVSSIANLGSPSIGSQSHLEGISFNLEKLDVSSIANLGSSLVELLQSDDPSSVDSSFVKSTSMNKLLVWKDDISKALELTESEIGSLENELKSMKFKSGNGCPCAVASSPLVECDAKACTFQGDASNSVAQLSSLQIASCGDEIVEKVPCCYSGLEEVHTDVKDDAIDSPGTATSKLVEPVSLVKADSSTAVVENGADFDAIQSAKADLQGLIPRADEEEGVFTSKDATILGDSNSEVPCSVNVISDTDVEDNLCNLILASNKEAASKSSEVFNKLLPSDPCKIDFSGLTNGSFLPSDAVVVERFVKRKCLLRFKERVVTLKFKAFQHLWKEDMRLLSIRKYHAKSQKKWELSLRTTQCGYQKHRSSIPARFSSPAGNLSLVPKTEVLNFTKKLLSDSQVKLHRNALKMPALILDKKERLMSRFVSSNGLVEDPCAVEKERAMINPWTAEEKQIFLEKLSSFGKDFQKIASFLDHKSCADSVEFYYKNHKSDCFEKTKRSKQTKSSTNYLVASSKKWNREMNDASLDILGVASVMAANADTGMGTRRLCSGKILSGGYNNFRTAEGGDGILERSSSFDVLGNERETAAADVLAGICGSMSSEAMGSCITTSVDLIDGFRELKCQKVDSVAKLPLTSDVTQNFDEDTCSDESCGEMDTTDWTDEEKSIFIQAVASYGKDFAIISRCVRTRTRDQCKVFFSKARKCLGLDLMHPGPRNMGASVSDDASEGGSDTEDACALESGSAVCSDKLVSKMDEDLPLSVMNTRHDGSDAEGRIKLHADLNGIEDNNTSGLLDRKDSKEVDETVSHVSVAGNGPDLGIDVVSKLKDDAVHQSETAKAEKKLIPSINADCGKDQSAEQSATVTESGRILDAVSATLSNGNAGVEFRAAAELVSNGMENGCAGRELLLPESSLSSPRSLMQDSTSNASCNPVNMDSCSDFSLGLENMHKVSAQQLESVDKPPVIALLQEDNLATKNSMSQDSTALQYEKKHDQDRLSSTLQERGMLCKNSVNRDDYFQHLPGHPLLNQNETSQILEGYPLQIPSKKEMNGDISCRSLSEAPSLPNSEKNVTSQFETQDGYLRKCSGLKVQHSDPELPFMSSLSGNESDHPRRLPHMEKPCRHGDVKLFGKILSNPLQKPSSGAHENGEKEAQNLKAIGKAATVKLTGHHPTDGNLSLLKSDRNNHLGLENIPMRSYGFWDGNRIQTGFSTIRDSTALLAKYPAAFGNYHVSSSKMSQQSLPAIVKSNDCSLNGTTIFPPSGSNGVVDYQLYRSHDSTGAQLFVVDKKQRGDVFAEMQRLNGQQARGMVGMKVVGRGGSLVGGPCTGVSDPVAAVKRHYAKADQYGGQNGIVLREEESWRSKGDIGR